MRGAWPPHRRAAQLERAAPDGEPDRQAVAVNGATSARRSCPAARQELGPQIRAPRGQGLHARQNRVDQVEGLGRLLPHPGWHRDRCLTCRRLIRTYSSSRNARTCCDDCRRGMRNSATTSAAASGTRRWFVQTSKAGARLSQATRRRARTAAVKGIIVPDGSSVN